MKELFLYFGIGGAALVLLIGLIILFLKSRGWDRLVGAYGKGALIASGLAAVAFIAYAGELNMEKEQMVQALGVERAELNGTLAGLQESYAFLELEHNKEIEGQKVLLARFRELEKEKKALDEQYAALQTLQEETAVRLEQREAELEAAQGRANQLAGQVETLRREVESLRRR